MAKKKSTLKVKKGKKKWFTVLAPAIFNNVELGEITAYEPNDIIGRHLEFSLKDITNSPKSSGNKVCLRITKLQGEKANTEVIKSFMLDSFIQRMNRRFNKRFISVISLKAKDASLKLKLQFLVQKKISNKIRASLLAQAEKELTASIAKINADSIFSAGFQQNLATNLKKTLKKIYPLDQVIIWKVSKQPFC